ncbi:MAG: ZIP family metal transporter [Clostridiales bacterium]|jgi:ZIP family zinc transporter|nr:ZIP family metal transporter [Clostridiales bacterium]
MTGLLWPLSGLGFIFIMTALGAGAALVMPSANADKARRVFLGFAAGVMTAAAVFSLLVPAIEEAERTGIPGALPSAGGFALGALFLFALDSVVPHLHIGSDVAEGAPSRFRRTTLLISAVTLHNIPEGMAVGLAFALAAGRGDGAYAAALALAIGIGVQNFPEGAAVSLPLRQEGMGRFRAFGAGVLSGAVEPVFGLLAVAAADAVAPVMPWLLSFAAGAMIYVVVEELIPEARLGEHSHAGTFSVLAGFIIMMALDVALG